jgi:NADH:ubiquinone oxidoreductase subunit F (NADH-binding)
MPMINEADCQTLTMDFDTLSKLKSGMATAAIIVDRRHRRYPALGLFLQTRELREVARRAAKARAGCGASCSAWNAAKAATPR